MDSKSFNREKKKGVLGESACRGGDGWIVWCVMMSASESPEYFLTGPTHTSGVSVSMPVPSFINSLSSVAEPHI